MSEYLNRLKQLRDAKPSDSFTPPNVHSNVSFRKAIDYIEQLEAELNVVNAVADGRGDRDRRGTGRTRRAG